MTDPKRGDRGSDPPPVPWPPRSEPTLHQLRLLLVVAEELHFGRAAARLFITQPALSRQITVLERHLGVGLFVRSSRTVEATAACRALLPEVRDVIEAMERLRRSSEAQHRELTGRLVVGSIGAESSMRHARVILAELRARYPELTVELRNQHLADHMRELLDGDVDVAFLRPPVPPGIQIRHLATEPRIACLPAGDPLASRPEITLADLAGHPVVDLPPQLPRVWWNFWAVDPRPDGSPVRYGPVVADMEALLHVVAEGRAMAFLPAAAREFFPRPGVSYVNVTDLPPSTSALAWATAHRDHPTVAAIRQAAAAAWPPR
ncbi:LysR family transcriptional regulator [Streptomyces sp. NA04227]|uniref:LysR family transcriptional regulator n=1 Tax=Streptomyces sp. NA04227 TaxID=2742136 RepID=UPI00159233EB|nr:LysR substrate-binding domain-containing protein [Streptomyces sp. NA04227]QKW05905.1 LysR family transcriptional regulator [Streptomyces sp. NA04227]